MIVINKITRGKNMVLYSKQNLSNEKQTALRATTPTYLKMRMIFFHGLSRKDKGF